MRTLRICLTAFLGGVLLASCGRTITGPTPCTPERAAVVERHETADVLWCP